jgi:hypothetical protein
VVVVVEIGAKVGYLSLPDALAIAVIKIAEEKLVAPVIGNGTIKSGIIKGVGALALDSFMPNGKLASYAKTALVIDAGEDIANQLLSGVSLFGMGVQQAQPIVV